MVDVLPLDRPFLERLTTAELLKLADSQGIDIPPGLDRTIVIEELLETEPGGAADKESPGANNLLDTRGIQEPPPLASDIGSAKPDFKSATASLPKHYNISYIEVLIRDPLWAFAFWEINAHDKETHERAPDFGGYCLRVEPVQEPGAGDRSFTVQVGTGDSAWYLGFPPEGGRYKVELCVMRKDEPVVLAVSKPFRLPTLPESPETSASKVNPLLLLSGIDDFNILRNTMRSSRLPKRYCAHTGVTAAGPRE
jgi:hypothetical protein